MTKSTIKHLQKLKENAIKGTGSKYVEYVIFLSPKDAFLYSHVDRSYNLLYRNKAKVKVEELLRKTKFIH